MLCKLPDTCRISFQVPISMTRFFRSCPLTLRTRTEPARISWPGHLLIRSATDGSVYLRENWCRSSILIKVRVTNWISEINAFSQQFVCILGD